MTESTLPTIGWREYVGLPEWGVERVRAKIDTGANTSTIDAFDIEELPGGFIAFSVVKSRRPKIVRVRAKAKVVRHTVVRSSTGDGEQRYVVRTRANVGDHEFQVELTLEARPRLLCRMLLGRRALAGRFLVDCAHRYVVTSHRKPRVADAAPPEPSVPRSQQRDEG